MILLLLHVTAESASCINTLTAQRRYQQATKFSVIFIGSEHVVYRRPKVGIIAWFAYYMTCFLQNSVAERFWCTATGTFRKNVPAAFDLSMIYLDTILS